MWPTAMSSTTTIELPLVAACRQQSVRDLAFLLSAPSPWTSGFDINPARLLGAQGEQRLRELDARPQPLLDWLASHQPLRRLGRYAELLLAFWFQFAPHIQLVSANLAVRDAKSHTVGEFDFLLRLDGEPWHLEVASKFYLQQPQTDAEWVGPGLQDAWPLKAAKLAQQLVLSRHPAASALLPPGFVGCRAGLRLTGWRFTSGQPVSQPAGWVSSATGAWPCRHAGARWVLLPRLAWLSPARVSEEYTLAESDLRARLALTAGPQLVAALQPDGTGAWCEVTRGFVTPSDWPDAERLAALCQRIQALPASTAAPAAAIFYPG